MIRTIILLIAAIVVVPVVAVKMDAPLNDLQKELVHGGVIIMLSVALACFLISEAARNYSQVDKIWSIMPIIYTWYFAAASGWNERMVLMALLATVWGSRLTYNFSRRGAYSWKFWSGEEDYRWKILRAQPALNTRLKWMFFNLFFISLYQNALVLLFTLPAVVVASSDTGIGAIDILLAVLFLSLICMETIADQQQWNYQKEKYRRINAGEPLTGIYANGFVSSGLWKYIRHPNYTAEQSIWVVFYLFTVAATDEWLNWSMAGCILLMLLFQGSADFSEKISKGKYPEYTDYQKKVGRFFPKIF